MQFFYVWQVCSAAMMLNVNVRLFEGGGVRLLEL